MYTILYTYVYHIVGYLGNGEALREITDLVHENAQRIFMHIGRECFMYRQDITVLFSISYKKCKRRNQKLMQIHELIDFEDYKPHLTLSKWFIQNIYIYCQV